VSITEQAKFRAWRVAKRNGVKFSVETFCWKSLNATLLTPNFFLRSGNIHIRFQVLASGAFKSLMSVMAVTFLNPLIDGEQPPYQSASPKRGDYEPNSCGLMRRPI
jgi:hypothetical protein